MEHSHLAVETLARLLAGRLEHEEVVNGVVPHLIALCPVCRQTLDEIRQLQDKVGHWDEEVVVAESRRAPGQLAELEGQTFEQQAQMVMADEEFHTWGLCQLLLEKSFESNFSAPVRGLELADLAVIVSSRLGEAYDPHWVLDIQATAHAYVGNSRRVLGEVRSSEAAFRKSEDCLARSMTGNLKIEAEIRLLKSSLRRDQGRFPDALELVERAISLYFELGEPAGLANARLRKAKILEESGDLEGAISLLEETSGSLVESPERWLHACARFNLLGCLALAGRFQQAHVLLKEVAALFADKSAQPFDFARVRWAEAMIMFGLGSLEEAEQAFREVQRQFLERHVAYDAALVSLDLAVLFAQQGRTQELKELALEIMPVFESREIHREAMACLIMFQNACDEERLTVELARQLAAFLRREQRSSRIVGT